MSACRSSPSSPPHLKLDMDRVDRQEERAAFLAACSNLNQRSIFNAVESDKLDVTRTTDAIEQNGLHFVVSSAKHDLKKQANIVKYLVSKGADVNQARTSDGWTPLFLAVMLGRSEVVSLLLQKGARVRHVDQEGLTCEDWAVKYRWDQIKTQLMLHRSKLPHSRFSIVQQGPALQCQSTTSSLGSTDTLSESGRSQSSEDSSLASPIPIVPSPSTSHPNNDQSSETCLLAAK
eukprot:maker-scaffold462_size163801-snap-gene-0.39 protein:Tk04564 transcript:maker-scaffold462_size163801-snap-gene-0.39-mRNA-1 annotation:"achain crystal structure of engineered northeast structural genomics consortium target"